MKIHILRRRNFAGERQFAFLQPADASVMQAKRVSEELTKVVNRHHEDPAEGIPLGDLLAETIEVLPCTRRLETDPLYEAIRKGDLSGFLLLGMELAAGLTSRPIDCARETAFGQWTWQCFDLPDPVLPEEPWCTVETNDDGPELTRHEDRKAAVAYAVELAVENIWDSESSEETEAEFRVRNARFLEHAGALATYDGYKIHIRQAWLPVSKTPTTNAD